MAVALAKAYEQRHPFTPPTPQTRSRGSTAWARGPTSLPAARPPPQGVPAAPTTAPPRAM
jgi:hypothetical protein